MNANANKEADKRPCDNERDHATNSDKKVGIITAQTQMEIRTSTQIITVQDLVIYNYC